MPPICTKCTIPCCTFLSDGSVVVDTLYIVVPIVCGWGRGGLRFGMQYLWCPFWFYGLAAGWGLFALL